MRLKEIKSADTRILTALSIQLDGSLLMMRTTYGLKKAKEDQKYRAMEQEMKNICDELSNRGCYALVPKRYRKGPLNHGR